MANAELIASGADARIVQIKGSSAMLVYSAARIILTFGAASLMTIITVLPVAAHANTVAPLSAASSATASFNNCMRETPAAGALVLGTVCKTRPESATEHVTIDDKNVIHQG